MTQSASFQMVAVAGDEDTRQMLAAVARQVGLPGAQISEGGASAALSLVRSGQPPELLVVDLADSPDPILDIRALLSATSGATAVIALGVINDVRLYRALIDAGARDYLVKPVTAEGILSALASVLESRNASASATPVSATAVSRSSRTVALIGARGGVGVTSLALSVGWDVAGQGRKTVVLDLDLHFGSAALSLDLEPGRGLKEILTNPDRVDGLLIDAAAGRAGEHLRILSAEEPLEDALELQPAGLTALLDALRPSAELVVIDVPRTLGPMSRQVLQTADLLAIVTDLSLPAMRDSQRLISLVRSLRGEAPLLLIANRVGGVGGEVSQADFERAVGAKINQVVRFDRAAAIAAAESAKPLIAAAKTPATVAALKAVSKSLSGEVAAPAGKAEATSWLRRLLTS
ncbi:MAG: AAA family ATPase [Alphaproteobacteria bacterium]|nr:AAA family ATPase [Alphaproteobacteria bacterium]